MKAGNPAALSAARQLTAAERTQVEAVDAAAASADGAPALNDDVRLDLQFGGKEAVTHYLARLAGDTVIGYAHLYQPEHPVEAATGHLVVDPRHRRLGVGSALLGRLVEAAPDGLQMWAHGDSVASRRLAESTGFRRVRELWQLRRPVDEPSRAAAATPLSEASLPTGVSLRTFEVGRDEPAWLELNAAAFADHPEQGTVGAAGLAQRMAQLWFDPAGFFLAERDGQLVGFHWTKVHPAEAAGAKPVGEVYVLGVSPDAQGLGLGKSLTVAGLNFLQARGVGEVMLYVEADNAPALGLYSRLGFARSTVDVMYQHP